VAGQCLAAARGRPRPAECDAVRAAALRGERLEGRACIAVGDEFHDARFSPLLQQVSRMHEVVKSFPLGETSDRNEAVRGSSVEPMREVREVQPVMTHEHLLADSRYCREFSPDIALIELAARNDIVRVAELLTQEDWTTI